MTSLTQQPFAGLDRLLEAKAAAEPEDKKFTAASFDESLITRSANGQFTSPKGGDSTGEGGHNSVGEGGHGKDVEKLQGYLQKLGYSTGTDAKGTFGKGTDAAVRKYQAEHNLKVDGLAGVHTFSSLRDHLAAGSSDGHSHTSGHQPKAGHHLSGPAPHGGAARFQPGGRRSGITGGTPPPSVRQGKDAFMETVEYKSVPVGGVQTLDEDTGVVEAIVSVTGVKDRVNDIIHPGSYQKTLATRKPKGVWSHDWDTPTSKTLDAVELLPGDGRLPKVTRDGKPWPSAAGALLIKMQFNLETQRGREAFSDVKFFGPDQEWSIGYNVPAGAASFERKSGTRNIKELELFEYSPVLFGAMPDAATRSVKSAQAAIKAVHAVDDIAFDAESGAGIIPAPTSGQPEAETEPVEVVEDEPVVVVAAPVVTEDELQALHDGAAVEIATEVAEYEQHLAEQQVADAVEGKVAVFAEPVTAEDLKDLLEEKVDTHPGDRHKHGGNAQTLRDYWAHGEGAAKIGWGTPGDFDRCVAEVEKYMPGQAKGYCNLRHHDALGIYPATHAKLDREGHGDVSDHAKSTFSETFIPAAEDTEVKDVWTGSAPPQTNVGGFGETQFGNPPDALSAQPRECPHCHKDDLVKRRDGDLVCPSCGFHYADASTPLDEVGNARAPYDGALKVDAPVEVKAGHLPCPKCHSRKADGAKCADCGAALAPKFGSKSRMSASVDDKVPPGVGTPPVGPQVEADPHTLIDNGDPTGEPQADEDAWLPCPNCKSDTHEVRTGKTVCAECGTALGRETGEEPEDAEPAVKVFNPAEPRDPATGRWLLGIPHTEPDLRQHLTQHGFHGDRIDPDDLDAVHKAAHLGETTHQHDFRIEPKVLDLHAEVKVWSDAARIAALLSRRRHSHRPESGTDIADTTEAVRHALRLAGEHHGAGLRGRDLRDAVERDVQQHMGHSNADHRDVAALAIEHHQGTTAGVKTDPIDTEIKEIPMDPTFLESALTGSMEDLQARLTSATDEWASKSDGAWTQIEGTWPDHVLFTTHDVKAEQPRTSWQVGFEITEDGRIELGEPQQVEDLQMVVPSAVKAITGMARLMESKGLDPDLLTAALDEVAKSQEPITPAMLDEVELLAFEALKEFGGGAAENKRFYSHEQRMEMAKTGEALPDGSFPIRDKVDLDNAKSLLNSGHGHDPAAAAAHIAKREAALGVKFLPGGEVKTQYANGFDGGTGGAMQIAQPAPANLGSSGSVHAAQQRAARMLQDLHEEARNAASDAHVASDHQTASMYLALGAQHLAAGNVETAKGHLTRALSAHDRALKDGEERSFGRVGGRAAGTVRTFLKGSISQADDGADVDTVPPQHTSGARGHAGNIRGLEAAHGDGEKADEGVEETKAAKKTSKAQEALFGDQPPAGLGEVADDTDSLLAQFEALQSGF